MIGHAEGENWLEAKVRGEESELATPKGSSRAPGRLLMGVGSPTEAAASACLTSLSSSCKHKRLGLIVPFLVSVHILIQVLGFPFCSRKDV